MNVSKHPHWLFSQVVGCAYQGVRNDRFSENLACFVFLKHPFWDSPYCLVTNKVSSASEAYLRPCQTSIMEVFIFFIVMVFQNCQNQFQQCFRFFPCKLYWIFWRQHHGNEYFLWATKNVNVKPLFKHDPELKRKTINQSVFFPINLKFMNAFLLSN